MKKFILIAFASLSLAMSGQEGQTSPGTDRTPADPGTVPSQVVDRFNKEYPGISGNWSKDGDNFRVEFTDPASRMGHVIIYDRNGEVVRRESELDHIPQSINEYYNQNYPGEKLKTWAAEDVTGNRYYYSWRNSQELRFDQEGRVMTPAKDKTASGRKKTKQ
jgi:hypothetical protein